MFFMKIFCDKLKVNQNNNIVNNLIQIKTQLNYSLNVRLKNSHKYKKCNHKTVIIKKVI